MKKWFQIFVDEKDSNESIPMRIDPEQIFGFKKSGEYKTIIFTKIGAYTVYEDYEHFSSRLFSFCNNDGFEDNETRNDVAASIQPPKKRYVLKRIVSKVDESYYEDHQPETNF